MTLIFESVGRGRIPYCFGTREFNERNGICGHCDQLKECKRKLRK